MRCRSLAFLSFVALTWTVGCNDKPQPAAPAPSQSSQVIDSPTASVPNPSRKPDNTNAAQASLTTPTNASGNAASGGAPSATAQNGKTKAPPVPSAEQLAKWAISEYTPLQLVACFDGSGDALVQSIAISPDGKQFATAGARLNLWWLLTDASPAAELLSQIKESEIERPLRTIAISPDGIWLAAGDSKGTLRMWKLAEPTEPITIKAHDARLMKLAFSPDSQTLATTSYSGDVRLWKTSDGSKIKSIKPSSGEIAQMAFVTDQLLATAGSEINLWNIETDTQEKVLSSGRVLGPALGLSNDRKRLAFQDSDSKVKFWDVATQALVPDLEWKGLSPHLIRYSNDGKWIAIYSNDATVRILDTATGQTVQVLDADGGRVSDLAWLPQRNVLMIASESGRVRIWGTPDDAKAVGIQPMELPKLAFNSATPQRPMGSAYLLQIIDVRSFPRLPQAELQWGQAGMVSYSAPATPADAELFYRYYLNKAGWSEEPTPDVASGLLFRKKGCVLNVSLVPATPPAGKAGDVQVTLNTSGNYDARWAPKHAPIDSNRAWSSFSTVAFSTKANLTDLEVGLLKQLHEAGWTAYSRLNASSNEDPNGRTLTLIQGASEMNVFARPPADAKDELHVQTSISVSNKSLPIPPDSGWIEYDASTDLNMVANTAMNLDATMEFYDREMPLDGWIARQPGRRRLTADDTTDHVERAILPYIRGQQDVVLRLVAQSDGGTRILVGEPERSSWQLQKPAKTDSAKEAAGIEVADFQLPQGAKNIKYDVDQKNIEFALDGVLPPALAEQIAKQMTELGWKQEDSGVKSDEYMFLTFTKSKAEVQLRARLVGGKNASAMIGGDGLLWNKPMPTGPERISYAAWLRRENRKATLEWLDTFAAEMKKIPLTNKGK